VNLGDWASTVLFISQCLTSGILVTPYDAQSMECQVKVVAFSGLPYADLI